MNENPLNVLLIEDDQADARYIEVLLADSTTVPCALDWAANIENAAARLSKGGIDVILLDLNLTDSTAQ